MALSNDPTTTDHLSRIVQNWNKGEEDRYKLNDSDFVFSAPIVNPKPLVAPGGNTIVEARTLATSSKIGISHIYYDRVNLAELPSPPLITKNQNTTIADVVAQLNDYYGLYIVADDYDTTASVAGSSVTITAKATSYMFIGQVTLTFAA